MFDHNPAAKTFDTMNEARQALGSFGLGFGVEYSGGATCQSAVAHVRFVEGKDVRRQDGSAYRIPSLKNKRSAIHQYTVSATGDGVIIDPTWRQFFRDLIAKEQTVRLPGILVGTLEEAAALLRAARGNPHKLDSIYSGGTVP
jgi:hypothetical protein